jgi:hypothetical protein
MTPRTAITKTVGEARTVIDNDLGFIAASVAYPFCSHIAFYRIVSSSCVRIIRVHSHKLAEGVVGVMR